MVAIARDRTQIIQMILENNNTFDINAQDKSSGVNPIWLACLYGHGNTMKILSEFGANVMCTNSDGVNLLHLAVAKEHTEIV